MAKPRKPATLKDPAQLRAAKTVIEFMMNQGLDYWDGLRVLALVRELFPIFFPIPR